MITITRSHGRISIKGHSGLAPPGQDIVCAAVSVLAQTLTAAIEALTEDIIQGHENPGDAEIKIGLVSERTKLLIEAFFIGVEGIAGAYPDNVKIITTEANAVAENAAAAKGDEDEEMEMGLAAVRRRGWR